MTVCFLLFQQFDLFHTFISSYAYLGGHFVDFYDFNKQAVGGNDYLPLIYIFFAIWNLPLYFLDLIPSVTNITLNVDELPHQLQKIDLTLQLAWSKLLIVILFFASAQVLGKISIELKKDCEVIQSRSPEILFLTAPLAIFAIFILGQYDIFSVFFTLLGFYYYLKKSFLKFAWFFSIAISFKYFALVIYIPLLLMIEKNLIRICKYFLIGISVILTQFIFYWHSQIFREEIFQLLVSKILIQNNASFKDNADSIDPKKIGFCIYYAMICAYLYFKQITNDSLWKKLSVFTPVLIYGLMFFAVSWHPQWLIIVTPFSALAYLYINNSNRFVCSELIGMFAFIWIIVHANIRNVDGMMLPIGILRQYIPENISLAANFLSWLNAPLFIIFFWYAYLFYPVIAVILQKNVGKNFNQLEMSQNLIFARFIIGTGMFLALALACVLV